MIKYPLQHDKSYKSNRSTWIRVGFTPPTIVQHTNFKVEHNNHGKTLYTLFLQYPRHLHTYAMKILLEVVAVVVVVEVVAVVVVAEVVVEVYSDLPLPRTLRNAVFAYLVTRYVPWRKFTPRIL